MRVIAIVQSRMGSSRLPGKMLLPLGDYPIINWVVQRLQKSEKITNLVVATSDQSIDDSLVNHLTDMNIDVFRGSENDVLDRYYRAAKFYNADIVVRITGDCPIIDPDLVDNIIDL